MKYLLFIAVDLILHLLNNHTQAHSFQIHVYVLFNLN